jgi:hypothetical protein
MAVRRALCALLAPSWEQTKKQSAIKAARSADTTRDNREVQFLPQLTSEAFTPYQKSDTGNQAKISICQSH